MPRSPFFGSTACRCTAAVGVCRVMHRALCLPKSRRELFCAEHGCRLRSGACAAPKLAFPQRSGHKKTPQVLALPAVFWEKAPRFCAKASRFSAVAAFLLNAVHCFHHGGGRKVDHQLAFHEIHVGRHMLEVAFPAGAEIGMAGVAGCVGDEARSRTVAVAGKAPFARFALRSEGFALVLSELALLGAVNHFGQRFFVQIAELKFRENIVVAGINVAVVFHCGGVSASFGHGAQTSRHAHPSGQRGIEHLHEESAHVPAHPFVEERA